MVGVAYVDDVCAASVPLDVQVVHIDRRTVGLLISPMRLNRDLAVVLADRLPYDDEFVFVAFHVY